MRVLMFGWEFPPHNGGGLGVACKGLARALAKQHDEITFVLPRTMRVSDSHMRFRFAEGVEMKVCPVEVFLLPYISAEDYQNKASGNRLYANDLFGEVYRYAKEAERIAGQENFDVIHAHDWLAFPAGLAAKEATGKPLVLHVHLPAVDQSGGDHADPRVFAIEQEAMLKADRVIAISHRVKDVLTEHYNIPEEKIRVVHNGIDPDETPIIEKEMPFAKEAPTALYMGRLTMHKGPDHFLNAARIVSEKVPDARFVIAGSGEMERQLIEQAAQLGIANKVFFPGFVRDEEKAKLLKTADVFVMPSVAEPFGLVALEAMAAGTPTIVSKQSGASEILKHALKVDFWDVEELANKMTSLFSYQSLKNALKKEGASEAQQSTWNKAATKCRSVYNECVRTPAMA